MSQNIATRWPNARNMLRPTMLRYVALACCDRLAGALLSYFTGRVLVNLFVGCQLCTGHAVDKDLLSLVQREVTRIIVDLAGHDARLDAVEAKLENDEEARREGTDEILERLVSMEKILSEELLRRVEGVEEGMAQLQDSLTKTDGKVEQLAHEIKSQRMEYVKPG